MSTPPKGDVLSIRQWAYSGSGIKLFSVIEREKWTDITFMLKIGGDWCYSLISRENGRDYDPLEDWERANLALECWHRGQVCDCYDKLAYRKVTPETMCPECKKWFLLEREPYAKAIPAS